MTYTWICGIWLLAVTAILATATTTAFGLNWPLILFVALVNIVGVFPVMAAAHKADAWNREREGRF